MSNDRIYVVCLGCGAWKTLLKFYPGDFDPAPETWRRALERIANSDEDLADAPDIARRALNETSYSWETLEWMGRHIECHPQMFENHLDGNPGFRLATMGERLPVELHNAEPPGTAPFYGLHRSNA